MMIEVCHDDEASRDPQQLGQQLLALGGCRQVMRQAHTESPVDARVPQRNVERRRRHPDPRRRDRRFRAAEQQLAVRDVGLDHEIRGIREGRREAAAAAGQIEDDAGTADPRHVPADQVEFALRALALQQALPVVQVVGRSAMPSRIG